MWNNNTPPLTCRRQITLSKFNEICQWAIPKQTSTISMHIPSLVKIHWYLLKLSSRNENTDISQADNSIIDQICPSAIPNQISTISMHTPSLVKINWYLLKLSSGNENTDVSRADNSVKNWRNLPVNIPKPDLYNINAHTVWWNSTEIYSSYRPETKIWMGGRTDGGTHGQPLDTIIPCHYRVVGYKNK